jgi:hypothetical protein
MQEVNGGHALICLGSFFQDETLVFGLESGLLPSKQLSQLLEMSYMVFLMPRRCLQELLFSPIRVSLMRLT